MALTLQFHVIKNGLILFQSLFIVFTLYGFVLLLWVEFETANGQSRSLRPFFDPEDFFREKLLMMVTSLIAFLLGVNSACRESWKLNLVSVFLLLLASIVNLIWLPLDMQKMALMLMHFPTIVFSFRYSYMVKMAYKAVIGGFEYVKLE